MPSVIHFHVRIKLAKFKLFEIDCDFKFSKLEEGKNLRQYSRISCRIL